MKKLIFILLLSFIYSCGNKYILENKSTLKFKETFFTTWSAGIKDGGSGYRISLKLNNSIDLKRDDILLEGIYFKGKYSNLKEQKKGFYQGYVGSKGNITSEEVILENNKKLVEKTPFKLENNEAVVSFTQRGKRKYFKIQLKKKNLKHIMDVPM